MSGKVDCSLAVVILTYNEELHLDRALASVSEVAEKVFVIDSFSTDRTVEIAKKWGANVLQNRFVNYANQFKWALDNAPIDTRWLLRLDADESLEPELVDELKLKLPAMERDVVGINLKRRHVFMGRWIRHGGRYPLILLRIFRAGFGRIEDRWMDEHLVVWGGRSVTFDNDFSDVNLGNLSFFIDKHNKYATREAIDRLNVEYHFLKDDRALAEGGSNFQARFKRFLKERIYNRLPFGAGPLCYFLLRYVLQRGFMDGREGLIYHFLQSYWYRFLIEAKVIELRRGISHLSEKSAIKVELSRLTGLNIQ